jgi:hypothetical protein
MMGAFGNSVIFFRKSSGARLVLDNCPFVQLVNIIANPIIGNKRYFFIF